MERDSFLHGPEVVTTELQRLLEKVGPLSGHLFRHGSRELIPFRLIGADTTGLRLDAAPGDLEPGQHVHITLNHQHLHFYLRVRIESCEDKEVSTSCPSSLWTYDQRNVPRTQVAPGEARVRIPCPWLEGGALEGEVLDLSAEGLAFRVAPNVLLFQGTPLPKVEILMAAGQRRSAGRIAHVTPRRDGDRVVELVVGLELREAGLLPASSRAPSSPGVLSRLFGWLERWLPVPALGRGGSGAPGAEVRHLTIRAAGGRRLKARLDLACPLVDASAPTVLVVIAPALGRDSGRWDSLTRTLIATFALHGRFLAVLRYDDPREDGEEPRPSRWASDLGDAVLEGRAALPQAPRTTVVITPDSASLAGRRFLARDQGHTVDLWVCIQGMLDGAQLLLGAAHGQDLMAVAPGQPPTLVGGEEVDAGALALELQAAGLIGFEEALRDLAAIPIPSLWFQPEEDPWIEAAVLERLLLDTRYARRDIVPLEGGRVTPEHPRAKAREAEVVGRLWQHLFREHVEVRTSEREPSAGLQRRERCGQWLEWMGGGLQHLSVTETLGLAGWGQALCRTHAAAVTAEAPRQIALLGDGIGLSWRHDLGALRGARLWMSCHPRLADRLSLALEDAGLARLELRPFEPPTGLVAAAARVAVGGLPPTRALLGHPAAPPTVLDRLARSLDKPAIWRAMRGIPPVEGDAEALEAELGPIGGALLTELRELLVALPDPPLPALPTEGFDVVSLGLMAPSAVDPLWLMTEAARALAPNGRLVALALHPDADLTGLAAAVLSHIQTDPSLPLPHGFSRQRLLEEARRHLGALDALCLEAQRGGLALGDERWMRAALETAGLGVEQVTVCGGEQDPVAILVVGRKRA